VKKAYDVDPGNWSISSESGWVVRPLSIAGRTPGAYAPGALSEA